MATPFIVSLDEGTTNAKAITVAQDGDILSKGSVPVQLEHPVAGWAEQDPIAIWEATRKAIMLCLEGLDVSDLKGVAISNQRESVLIWDRQTGKPLSPVVSWQCRRSEALCQTIAFSLEADEIKQRTGAVLDPLYPASKIKWLLNHLENGMERAKSGELCVGTIDVWLVWQLTAGESFVTDFSNASRYQLFNIHTGQWDARLLEIFAIPEQCLPEIRPSSGYRGVTKDSGVLPDAIPVLSQIGDSHAALYGQDGFVDGVVKATYGTGSSLMTKSSFVPEKDFGVGTTVAWHDGELSIALEGNITHTGSALGFVTRLLGISGVDVLSEMAQSVNHNQGVYFVPALAGLGAPYWDSQARGIITGLTDATTPAVVARAAFESVTYQIADLFFAMEKTLGKPLETLSVDGGPTKNRWLMQLQADVLQRPIVCGDVAEVSALGAAYLAGRALGWWKTYADLLALPHKTHTILPNPKSDRIEQNYQAWQSAVQKARFN
ncbi:FGGY family carbohydrate kinase [Testudinibacter sp. TR-2022]|uniref:FGGY family carbohydrate kinase n=1 Tax=Testudinibacter sp. TR-2022 TaxID=2585029 RepID=UPI001117F6FB|nr:FGGY-family carbohydrate kinase [Testudinibacter sp. TR-2022]TNH07843.1 glycerol kinase [Pasteurellaceae bacterium Phil11]TNH24633.1 glycerol kinase [Testudinibacter sp. TR-2022]TNH28121.1 glycerol kinase [Testudinibacter sp. TR-2022]